MKVERMGCALVAPVAKIYPQGFSSFALVIHA